MNFRNLKLQSKLPLWNLECGHSRASSVPEVAGAIIAGNTGMISPPILQVEWALACQEQLQRLQTLWGFASRRLSFLSAASTLKNPRGPAGRVKAIFKYLQSFPYGNSFSAEEKAVWKSSSSWETENHPPTIPTGMPVSPKENLTADKHIPGTKDH